MERRRHLGNLRRPSSLLLLVLLLIRELWSPVNVIVGLVGAGETTAVANIGLSMAVVSTSASL